MDVTREKVSECLREGESLSTRANDIFFLFSEDSFSSLFPIDEKEKCDVHDDRNHIALSLSFSLAHHRADNELYL